ncbi:hypothetical protein B0H13DRAFT_806739 [Mycena leptocephala]|nr:hypothetical protein B0H13DRAFT_806739 [Mycena leptocephala]
MALTSVPLRSLDLSAMQVRPTLLRNISSYLSTIESLKVRLAVRHTLHTRSQASNRCYSLVSPLL